MNEQTEIQRKVPEPKKAVADDYEITVSYFTVSGTFTVQEKFNMRARKGGDGKCYMADVANYVRLLRDNVKNRPASEPLKSVKGFPGSLLLESNDGAKFLIMAQSGA